MVLAEHDMNTEEGFEQSIVVDKMILTQHNTTQRFHFNLQSNNAPISLVDTVVGQLVAVSSYMESGPSLTSEIGRASCRERV